MGLNINNFIQVDLVLTYCISSYIKVTPTCFGHYTRPSSGSTHYTQATYRVIQEESAILWEMIVCVILSKKVHTNMGLILDGYEVMTA